MLEIAICDAESGRTPTSNTLSPRSPEFTIRTITDRFNPLQMRGELEFGVASYEWQANQSACKYSAELVTSTPRPEGVNMQRNHRFRGWAWVCHLKPISGASTG